MTQATTESTISRAEFGTQAVKLMKVVTDYLDAQAKAEALLIAIQAQFAKLDSQVGWEDGKSESTLSAIQSLVNGGTYPYKLEMRFRWSEKREAEKAKEAADIVADSQG